jgi:hypothetical protein
MCYLKDLAMTPKLHKDNLLKALDYLRDNLPRTIVNLVSPPREYIRKVMNYMQHVTGPSTDVS